MQEVWIVVCLLGACYYFFVCLFIYLGELLDYPIEVYFFQPLQCVPLMLLLMGHSLGNIQRCPGMTWFYRTLFVSFLDHTQLLSSINCQLIAYCFNSVLGHTFLHRHIQLKPGFLEQIVSQVSVGYFKLFSLSLFFFWFSPAKQMVQFTLYFQ